MSKVSIELDGPEALQLLDRVGHLEQSIQELTDLLDEIKEALVQKSKS